MEYKNSIHGTFLERCSRFLGKAEIEGAVHDVHIKTTGRCRELFLPGAPAYFEKSCNPNRKTQFSLTGIRQGEHIVNVDSQAPNAVVAEGLQTGGILLPGLRAPIAKLQREVTRQHSRFDFYAETCREKVWIEAKGVTLQRDGVALFPDAPSLRGLKHVEELIQASRSGEKAYLIFLIQREDAYAFQPNAAAQPEFAVALCNAVQYGVQILAYRCRVTEKSIHACGPVHVFI